MSVSQSAAIAALLVLASTVLAVNPSNALPCGSNFPPTTVQEVRDCIPPPPPPPSKCDAMPDYVETELRASGKIDDDCNLNPPTCQNTIPPSGPVSCNPDPEKTCQGVFANSMDPDPCNPPSCEAAANNTGTVKPSACTPPTCLEASGDAGMDSQVAQAACDTIQPPVCEEVGQYFTVIGHNDSVPSREEDCLPTLCVDLEEPTACLPGCQNVRDIVGGVGHLLLGEDCLPRKPLCEEVEPYTPIQPDFWIDCVPWGLPPTCEEVVDTVNGITQRVVDGEVGCGLGGGLPPMDPPVTVMAGANVVFNFQDHCVTPGTQELLPANSAPAEAGFSCTAGDQACSYLTNGENDLILIGTATPHGAGYVSLNEHNTIYDRYWFCRTKVPDGNGYYHAVISYENYLTAGDACNQGGTCHLAGNDWGNADQQEWRVTYGGAEMVDFAPKSRIAFGGTTCLEESVMVGPIGASWPVCSTNELSLNRGQATAGGVKYFMHATGPKRTAETPEYGLSIRFEDPGDYYAFTFSYSMMDKFHHSVPVWMDHTHTYRTEGSIGVYLDHITAEVL